MRVMRIAVSLQCPGEPNFVPEQVQPSQDLVEPLHSLYYKSNNSRFPLQIAPHATPVCSSLAGLQGVQTVEKFR